MEMLCPVEIIESLAMTAMCRRCCGEGEVDHECDCDLCTETHETCRACRGSGKNRNDSFPREINSDDHEFCHELRPHIRAGWTICIVDHGGKFNATAERVRSGSLQFVQESAVYLADLIERIAAAMDGVQ